MLVGEAHYLHHLIAALRVDYSLGPNRRVVGEDAAPGAQLAFLETTVLWQDGAEFREQVHALVCLDGVGEGSEACISMVTSSLPSARPAGRGLRRRLVACL